MAAAIHHVQWLEQWQDWSFHRPRHTGASQLALHVKMPRYRAKAYDFMLDRRKQMTIFP